MDELIGFLIVYLQIQNLSDLYVLKFTPLVVLVLLAAKYYSKKTKTTTINFLYQNKVISFLLIIMIIGSIRYNDPEITAEYILFRDVVFILFIAIFIKVALIKMMDGKKTAVDMVYSYILMPFALLAALNIVCWALGVKLKSGPIQGGLGDSVLLSYLGIHLPRVSFPLTEGYNNYSSLIGALFTLSLTNIIFLKYKRTMNFLMCCVFVLTLFMVDSRAGALYPFMVIAFVFFIKNFKSISKLKLSFLFPVVGPVVLTLLLPFLGQYDAFSFLSRSSDDLKTGNSRFLIWSISFLEFSNFKPIHLIGFGEFGHLGSGASKIWASIFNSWEDSSNKSPHNTMLVILFDYGYLGLIFYLTMLRTFITDTIKMWKLRRPERFLYLAYFIFVLLQGVTESTFGFYFMDYVFIFYAIFIIQIIDFKKYNAALNDISAEQPTEQLAQITGGNLLIS